jgi:hypothetical protein
VVFKPGAKGQKKGKALGKGNAREKKVLRKGGKNSGDVSLVTVEHKSGQSKKAQMRAAAGSIQNGEGDDSSSICKCTDLTVSAPAVTSCSCMSHSGNGHNVMQRHLVDQMQLHHALVAP